MLGFVGSLGRALLTGVMRWITVALMCVAAVLVILAGFELYYFFVERPGDVAAMQARSGIDLSADVGSLDQLTQALGPPSGHAKATEATNAQNYFWCHDDAIRAEIVDGTPVNIELGDDAPFHLIPYRRPQFPGSFLGLRLGDPVPTAAQAAAIQTRVSQCCDNASLTWQTRNGRVSIILYERSDYHYTPAPASQGG